MKHAVTALLSACCLLVAFPTRSEASAPFAAIGVFNTAGSPAACVAARTASSLGGPIAPGCFVQTECSDGTILSCNGNTTCGTSSDGRCTICDGTTTACCPLSCCEICAANLDNCLDNCVKCNLCGVGYNYCVNNCTGGCSW